MAEIALTKGLYALVDDADLDLIKGHSWCATIPNAAKSKVYAQSRIGGTNVYLHRFILNAPKGVQVDHINGNGLDNRRSNLRLASPKENARSVRRHRDSGSPYKGVHRYKARGNWSASIMVDGQARFIGYFETAEAAARAYDQAARSAFGEFALLNFPKTDAA